MDISQLKWFFKPVYQLTDESDATPVLDPDTDVDEGEEVPMALTLKPCIMHPPLY